MQDENYTKLLIENSFKEANLFWIRNSAISLVQSIIIGFFLNVISDKNKALSPLLFYMICVLGIVIGGIHFYILHLSEKSNLGWFNGLKDWISTKSSGNSLTVPFNHLNKILQNFNYKRNSLKNVTSIIKLIPILLMVFWGLMIIFKCKVLIPNPTFS